MIYYLLGLALLLVVISWIYCNYPFNMTQGDHSYEGVYIAHSAQEARLTMRRCLDDFTNKVLLNGAQSSWWDVCCSVYEAVTGILGNAIPSPRSILVGAAAMATRKDTRQSNTDNQPTSAHQKQKQEDYSEEEEECADEEDMETRGGRRKNQRKKKQKKRRKNGRRRRQAVRIPIEDQAACVKEGARAFQKRVPRYVEQEDNKKPSAVEELLRLDREATMATVLKIDQLVGNALGLELTN